LITVSDSGDVTLEIVLAGSVSGNGKLFFSAQARSQDWQPVHLVVSFNMAYCWEVSLSCTEAKVNFGPPIRRPTLAVIPANCKKFLLVVFMPVSFYVFEIFQF
jgi:hypothetical protein